MPSSVCHAPASGRSLHDRRQSGWLPVSLLPLSTRQRHGGHEIVMRAFPPGTVQPSSRHPGSSSFLVKFGFVSLFPIKIVGGTAAIERSVPAPPPPHM
jgi:hypothetical protein